MNSRPMPPKLCAAILLMIVTSPGAIWAAMDRNPELKSRALAWTEYDGSYLVDTNSRAEVLNFYWTVLARPFPKVEWTGTLSPEAAGTISEAFRLRNYAQLNAYRAFNYSPAMREDPAQLSLVQEGALVMALNPTKSVTHFIDNTWIGYTEFRAKALADSLLNTYYQSSLLPDGVNTTPFGSALDSFVQDGGDWNAASVGHRTYLLRDANTTGALGQAYCPPWGVYSVVWNTPMLDGTTPPDSFVAWPSPGYFPLAYFRLQSGSQKFRWSFMIAGEDYSSFWAKQGPATVSAKVNGVPVQVKNLVLNGGVYPITWEFDPAVLDLTAAPDGTTVEIEIGNVFDVPFGSGIVRKYAYKVTFLDENKIVKTGYAPQTPLTNISTRSAIETGDRQMIAGFAVTGDTPIRVALRTQGPGLARYGVQNAARKTKLQLFDADNKLLGDNNGWKNHQDWRLLQSLDLNPSDDNEAGMVATLWPGRYTAIVSDDTGSNGVGIVEAFAIDNLSDGRLLNLSTRAVVGGGEQTLIAGFNLKEERTVLIRTQGPGLTKYGVGGAVSDTQLTIVRDGKIVAENDEWQNDTRNARLKTDLASLAPSDSREAALLVTLPAGGYTALVTGKGTAGVGIVEVFDLGK